MGGGVIFEEIECKTIINKANAPGMMFRWSINPYRGCQHACIYCFARNTHEYLGYNAGRDFETRIVVKTNAAQVLREQLRKPSWQREVIVLGTACDPYQQAELKYQITRQMLPVFVEFVQPVHMLTKSPSVLRDLDLWARLTSVADAQIAFSVPTLDEAVWKKTEPGTARPSKRFEAMRRLVDAGVPCGVMMAPVIPGITDATESIEAVVRAAADSGASFVAPNVLNLKPGTKEWFMPVLRESFPHLEGKYQHYYKGPYAPKDYTREVISRVAEVRAKYGMDREHHMTPTNREPRGQLALGI